MLASITPLGERGRRSSWPTTVAAHVVAAAAVASAQGAVLGALGSLLPIGQPARTAAIAVLLAAAVGLDVAGRTPPGIHRQVAEAWLDTYRGWVYGGGFGLQLGLGWATIVTTWLVWAALGASLLAGSWQAGSVVGLAFGLGRGLPVLGSWRVVDGDALRRLHVRIDALERPFRRASLVAGAAAAGLLLLVAGTASGIAGVGG